MDYTFYAEYRQIGRFSRISLYVSNNGVINDSTGYKDGPQ